VFHWLQDGHLPTHFGEEVPQLRQKNILFILLITVGKIKSFIYKLPNKQLQ
jgi:hypothetical protein